MIAVTCRNGEHFSIDAAAIEPIDTTNDTVVHMIDGSKYVVEIELDELFVAVRDDRAAAFAARNRLADGCADAPAAERHRGEAVPPDLDQV